MKKTLRFVLLGLLALGLTAFFALVLIVRLVLAPASGEWAAPIALGPLRFEVGVPTAIRLATSSWFAPHLDGRSLDTAHGTLKLGWNEAGQNLEMHCTPCSVTVPALGAQPVRVARLFATVRRDGNALAGRFEAQPEGAEGAEAGIAAVSGALQGRWDGRLTQQALQLTLDAEDAPIARWYAVMVPTLPELKQARIAGTLGLRVQLGLPEGALALQPRIAAFSVEGLGSEALLGARSSCGASAKLTKDSWLARAVISAEDQRFFQHPGYDLEELGAALAANQKRGGIERGGSTLTQQLAKLAITGSERSGERKLRELLYAVEMEQTLGKARILQLYLDNAPWGGALCGAEAAAKRYFNRSARTLEPAQAAWLAAMLHKPSAELAQWQSTGSIDAARFKRVAEGIRGISRAQREALLKGVAAARFAAPS
ncbi:biosynthetic peptidoglycan transglycosylase [Variovorax sp. LT1R16]|uniref:biosynthetic peptidoglycan transglycosylase n=1 Tax=Variovorax sp. LT1R16 TaxID=3443728 RepID=UPI003F463528